MFKVGSFEQELQQSMETQLASNYLDGKHGFQRLARAVEMLAKAASIFEAAEMPEIADAITDAVSTLTENV